MSTGSLCYATSNDSTMVTVARIKPHAVHLVSIPNPNPVVGCVDHFVHDPVTDSLSEMIAIL